MSVFTAENKTASTFTGANKSSSTFTAIGKSLIESFLLREDNGYMLREDGGKIIREDSVASYQTWTAPTKN